MLYYALIFLVIALMAGVLGLGAVAGTATAVAQLLLFLFMAFVVVSLFASTFRRAS